MYKLTVQASGNVHFSDNDISFTCDQVNPLSAVKAPPTAVATALYRKAIPELILIRFFQLG
jgi:hypothetical protein